MRIILIFFRCRVRNIRAIRSRRRRRQYEVRNYSSSRMFVCVSAVKHGRAGERKTIITRNYVTLFVFVMLAVNFAGAVHISDDEFRSRTRFPILQDEICQSCTTCVLSIADASSGVIALRPHGSYYRKNKK